MPNVTEITAKLRVVEAVVVAVVEAVTECARTQRVGSMLVQWAGLRCRQGPHPHLESECLVHRAGFGCAASPSSGLGHLQIHGRLKTGDSSTVWMLRLPDLKRVSLETRPRFRAVVRNSPHHVYIAGINGMEVHEDHIDVSVCVCVCVCVQGKCV